MLDFVSFRNISIFFNSGANVGLNMRISQSAPALSTYLGQHITEFSDIDCDEMIQNHANNTRMNKSPTVDNFLPRDSSSETFLSNGCDDSNAMYDILDDKLKSGEKGAKFVLGNEENLSDFTDSGLSFSLSGNFGSDPFSWQKDKTPRRKDSKDHLSEFSWKGSNHGSEDGLSEYSENSGNSDFSVIFEDTFEGVRLTNIDSSKKAVNAQVNGFSGLFGGLKSSSTSRSEASVNNRLFGFDVFGASFDVDDDTESLGGLQMVASF